MYTKTLEIKTQTVSVNLTFSCLYFKHLPGTAPFLQSVDVIMFCACGSAVEVHPREVDVVPVFPVFTRNCHYPGLGIQPS